MPEPAIWSGQGLVGDLLAAVVRPGADWHLDVQCGEGRCRVPENRLGDFLTQHADRRFVCQDAGEFHGALERTLGKNEAAARAALWDLSQDGRLVDVSLLAILVRDAKQWSPHERSESPEPQLFEPGALLARTGDLLQQASEVSRGLTGVDLAKGFGPLGLALEVQARIAACCMSRFGLQLRVGAHAILKQACEDRRIVLENVLRRDPASRKILKVRNARRNAEATGLRVRKSKKLEDWLVTIRGDLCDFHGIPLPAPESQRYQDWRDYANAHPLVGAWIELMDVSTLQWFLRSRETEEIHPRYLTIDGIEAVAPKVELTPTLGCAGPVFRPRIGHHFVVARLGRLTQRCLAHVLNGLDPQSSFASALDRSGGPIEHLALRLKGFDYSGSVAGAAALPPESWYRIAREILELASTGNSPDAIRLGLERQGVRLIDHEVQALVDRAVFEVYPELGRYLRCTVQELIATKLGITEEAWTRFWTERFGRVPDPAMVGRTFFRQCGGRYHCEIIAEMLVRLNSPCSEIRFLMTLPEMFAFLTSQNFVGPTGRVYGNASVWHALGKYHILLADAIRKKAVYELARSGLTVCGIFGDAILVEASSSPVGCDACEVAEAALQPVLKRMLHEIPGGLELKMMREFPSPDHHDNG